MSFASRQKRMQRERPITCKYQLWAAWFLGAASHYHPGHVHSPLHPDASREFHDGRSLAARGMIVVPDLNYAFELARYVRAGNAPHTFKGEQLGMAL
jgi:hypothetical protein